MVAFTQLHLFPKLDNAGAQLPHLFIGCGNCGLYVFAFFEPGSLQFFPKAENSFFELYYFEIWTHLTPASSWSKCQFSRRSCFEARSVAEGLPSLSKCLVKRPSERANVTKSTASPVLGLTYQSSFTFGLPARLSRSLNL